METSQTPWYKFMQALITTLRQISIYPPGHPSIVTSLKSVLSALNLMFMDKDKFNVNLSPDKNLFFDGEAVAQKNMPMAADFIRLFDRLGVEDISFLKGIDEPELNSFIAILVSSGDLRNADLGALFAEKGVSHIVARQFSYLKVEKGAEAVLAVKSPTDELKTRVKAYCQGGVGGSGGDKDKLEKDIFDLITAELKDKGKPTAGSRDLLRKYLQYGQEQDQVMGRLRQVLSECGIAAETVDEAVKKLTEEPAVRSRRKVEPGGQEMAAEAGRLQQQVAGLERQIEEKNVKIAALEKENKKAFEDKHRIDNIIHNLAEGMVVVDSDGNILLANTAAENLLGISSGDVGKPVKDVVRQEHLLTMTRSLAAEMEGSGQKDIEFVSSSETTKKVLRASSAVVEDKNGNTIGMVTMLNDITRQKELEKLKTDFLSNVSHELRTPLVAIEKSVALMISKDAGVVSETQAQFLSIAERNLRRLTLLINDLLDLSKFEAGKMALTPEKTDLPKLISDCVATMETWARTKALKIERKMEEGLPFAWVDPNRLAQVLVNLLGNAVKFTPQEGTITVSAVRGRTDGELMVTVQDTGMGIPPDELEKIFDKFYQTKQRSNTDISGTGIGLAIVKEIVTLHGGRVWAESDGTNGARFIFTIRRWSDSLAPDKEASDGR